ncbi:MAG: hypothetical protein M0Q42_02175 [Xanthomonadales bacterium]|nr:hypothetical protein [Xanthomonadales bacterium]
MLYLREQGTAAKQFLSMNLQNTGTIRINDAAGLALVIPNAIPFGQSMLIEVIHDLDWRSYDLLIDGVAMLSNRSHGITDRGIGAVIFALQHQAEFDETRVLIDDLLVARWLPDMIFAHGFEGPR